MSIIRQQHHLRYSSAGGQRRFRYPRSPVAHQRVDVHRHAPLLDGARAIVARRRRRRARSDYRTLLLGLLALLTTGGVAAGELARVWQRGAAPLPAETEDVLGAAEEAARQTVEVAVAGYREGSRAEATLLGVLASFTVTLGAVRGATHLIHSHGPLGPLRNLTVGRRHIHHFVPGITLAFLAGGASIVFPRGRLSPWLALPFGTGLALTLDESALLLDLDDVYWTEEGIISVQIALGALGMLSALVLVLRLLRRGESTVLEAPSGDQSDPVVLSLVPDEAPQKPLGITGLADEGGA